MKTLLILIGSGLLIVGLLLQPFFMDLLPVDLLPRIQGIFTGKPHMYLRVVPSGDGVDPLTWAGLTVAATGLTLIGIGYSVKATR